jgi:hypothetical protein
MVQSCGRLEACMQAARAARLTTHLSLLLLHAAFYSPTAPCCIGKKWGCTLRQASTTAHPSLRHGPLARSMDKWEEKK